MWNSEALTAYTFDDFILVPQHSDIKSRSEPNPATKVGHALPVPIIAAPMNTVTESEMATAMSDIGADSVLHRYLSIEDQCKEFRAVVGSKPWVAVGASGDYLERAQELYKKGVRKFCVDVANGHSQTANSAIYGLKYDLPDDIVIMAGNVCTAEGATALAESGANVVRVGVGPGSMCTTRLVTGHGLPQLSAIADCVSIKYRGNGHSDNSLVPSEHHDVAIVADGGIRTSSDVVKAIAIGADAVMIGGLLAGTSQSPGDTMRDQDGNLYKMYHGMASEEGRKNWFDRAATSFVPEGKSTRVAFKGCAKRIVETLCGGLQVGMSFSGAHNLTELRGKAEWARVTGNGRIEATPNRKLFRR